MAKRSENRNETLIGALDELAAPVFWKVFREHVRLKAESDREAAGWFAAAREGKFNPEICRRYAREYRDHANQYHKAATECFEKCSSATRLLANGQPGLLGDFPVFDWEIIASINPGKMAQRIRKLLGNVLERNNTNSKAAQQKNIFGWGGKFIGYFNRCLKGKEPKHGDIRTHARAFKKKFSKCPVEIARLERAWRESQSGAKAAR